MGSRKPSVAQISIIAWPLIVLSIFVGICVLPLFLNSNSYMRGASYGTNLSGFGKEVVLFSLISLALVVYAAKYRISHLNSRKPRRYWFTMLVAASLPVIWLTIVTDWNDRHVYPITHWVYYPIGFWMIPTITFIVDTNSTEPPPLGYYVARSVLEWMLFVPWAYFWAFISFFMLGGGWV